MRGALGKSVRIGAIAGIVFLALAGAAVLATGRFTPKSESVPERGLLVFAAPDEEGARVAWVVLDADLANGTVRGVDTSAVVDVPGTTYSDLRDAFAFGGGAAVAEAYSRFSGSPLVPSVVVREAEWKTLVGAGTGVTARVGEGANVFTGDELVRIPAGEVAVDGDLMRPLLLATAYMAPERASAVRMSVAKATYEALKADPGALGVLAAQGKLRGDMEGEVLEAFCARVATALPGSTFMAE